MEAVVTAVRFLSRRWFELVAKWQHSLCQRDFIRVIELLNEAQVIVFRKLDNQVGVPGLSDYQFIARLRSG